MTTQDFNVFTTISQKQLHTWDLSRLIHCGPLRFGHQLHRHPDVQGYAIGNQAGEIAFWDCTGKPFLTLGAVYAWVADHRPTHAAPVTRPLQPVGSTFERQQARILGYLEKLGGVE